MAKEGLRKTKKYKIHYTDLGIIQTKNLIDHQHHIIGKSIFCSDKRIMDELVSWYYSRFGLFFTDESPLYKAMSTGVLKCNGREWNVEITEIKKEDNVQSISIQEGETPSYV